MSHTITMERLFSRKVLAKMNTDLTVEITDLAWTITKAEPGGRRKWFAGASRWESVGEIRVGRTTKRPSGWNKRGGIIDYPVKKRSHLSRLFALVAHSEEILQVELHDSRVARW